MGTIALLGKLFSHGAWFDLATGLHAQRTSQRSQCFGFAGARQATVCKGGISNVNPHLFSQLGPQVGAGIKQARPRTGCAPRAA